MDGSAAVRPWTQNVTLSATLRVVAADPHVVAIGLLGSTGTAHWTDGSDYDLLLVVGGYPPGFGLEVTTIDHRIADVVIADQARVATLGGRRGEPEPTEVSPDDWPYVAWLSGARWAHDPSGVGATAQQRASALLTHRPTPAGADGELTRSFLSHDVRVNAAMLRRLDEPHLRAALGMRQLHTFIAAVNAWFRLRQLPNEGWKRDMAALADLEPGTFVLVQQWLDTADLHRRHDLFADLVRRSLAPVGGPIPDGMVARTSSSFWQSLAP